MGECADGLLKIYIIKDFVCLFDKYHMLSTVLSINM
jgi:hypothetical protein